MPERWVFSQLSSRARCSWAGSGLIIGPWPIHASGNVPQRSHSDDCLTGHRTDLAVFEFFPKIPQDRAACGNYPLSMAEMMLLQETGGSASWPIGLAIDWSTKLAEHDRWLRTIVLARLGERQAVDEVMQEVALAAVAQRAPLSQAPRDNFPRFRKFRSSRRLTQTGPKLTQV